MVLLERERGQHHPGFRYIQMPFFFFLFSLSKITFWWRKGGSIPIKSASSSHFLKLGCGEGGGGGAQVSDRKKEKEKKTMTRTNAQSATCNDFFIHKKNVAGAASMEGKNEGEGPEAGF